MLLLAVASQVLGCSSSDGGGGGGGGGSTSTGLNLNLTPQNPQAMAGQTVTFSVTAPAGVTGTLSYDWTQTSAFATLSADTTGNKLTTASLSVKLITTPSDSAPITVTVTAYQTPSGGGSRTQVGSASTTVTVSTTLAPNTMTLTATDTDPNNAANNFNQTFPVSVAIKDGGVAGSWVWAISDLGDPGTYPFQARITTPVSDELKPPSGSSSLSVPYAAVNTTPSWVLLNGNGGYVTGSAMIVTPTQNGAGFTYHVTFSATNHTQTVSGVASFDVTTFPPN